MTIINESGLYSLILSSREIAELVESRHDNVLKTVRRLISEGVVFGNDTPTPTPQNGQTYTEFKLDSRNPHHDYPRNCGAGRIAPRQRHVRYSADAV